jgi:hypothetical protein
VQPLEPSPAEHPSLLTAPLLTLGPPGQATDNPSIANLLTMIPTLSNISTGLTK